MSRSERLLALLQALRRRRRAVSGQALAEELGVSIRTLYRDIASLQSQGASIEGSPGVGYVMKPGFMLPPLMFRPEEMEALALGLRWVADRGDGGLASGARDAMAKLAAVMPAELRRELEASALLVGGGRMPRATTVEPDLLRAAIRAERKLRITYRDAKGDASQRVVWPIALVYFEQSRVLSAWCELRGDFRNFSGERIAGAELLETRYPKRRQALLRDWEQTVRAKGRDILPESDILPP
jgi:predicted DNA-binding transcriptional regulator YafY